MEHEEEQTICPLCERSVPVSYTTKHHLVPKSREGKITVPLCFDCHRQLHVLFDLKALEKTLNTIEALKENPDVQTWIAFISKRKSMSRLPMRRRG